MNEPKQFSFENTPSAAKIVGSIQSLVRILVGRRQEGKENELQGTVQYALRILSSRLSPSVTQDEWQLSELIKRALVDRSKQGDSSHTHDLRFAELFSQLQDQRALHKKWAILYLLYSLRSSSDSVVPCWGPSPLPVAPALPRVEAAQSLPMVATREPRDQPHYTALIETETMQKTKLFGGLEVPESDLVRDIVYCFQGLDGQYIAYSEEEDCYCVSPRVHAPSETRELIRSTSELGWLFRRIQAFLVSQETGETGLVEQSFCGAVQDELGDYYRLIAVLEGQILASQRAERRAVVEAVESDYAAPPPPPFTLRRVFVWAQEPTERLRLLAMLVDAAKQMKGGALVSAVASFALHGDPAVCAFVQRIQSKISQPLLAMIHKWVTVGELHDPFGEFFVAVDPTVLSARLWQSKYRLRKTMIPSFVDEALAKTILVVGKSINFIRECCSPDGFERRPGTEEKAERAVVQIAEAFTAAEAKDSQTVFELRTDMGEWAALIREVAQETNKRLMKILQDDFRVSLHCLALKKYLLLGQGDFIQVLMDLVNKELAKPAHSVLRHNLLGLLKAAIRSSNAQYEEPDVLNRLNVRLLRAAEGDQGWDVFSLDYMVAHPLNVIFTPKAVNKYLRVFNFLWRLKRVEHDLSASWRTIKASPLTLNPNLIPQLADVLHQSFLLRSSMDHFIGNLHSFMMFEVMECAWKELCEDMQNANDLDELIAAHEKYLQQIVDKALMGASSTSAEGARARRSASLLTHVTKVFDVIVRFAVVVRRLYDAVSTELHRRHTVEASMQARSQAGGWGISGEEEEEKERKDTAAATRLAGEYGQQLAAIKARFDNLLFRFLDACEAARDSDLRFLHMRLDFSELYARQRRNKR